MFVYMVYGYDQYYPETADNQVIGLYASRSDAIAAMEEITKSGKYEFVDYVTMRIQ